MPPVPPATPDHPLALLGFAPDAARALRQLGLIAVNVPTDDLTHVMDACRTLKFTGALVHPALEAAVAAAVTPDTAARRAGRVDAVAFSGTAHGVHTLADALGDTLGDSTYALRGASALLLGLEAADLGRGLPLTRLGLTIVGVCAETISDAERVLRDLPAGVRGYALARRDPSVQSFAERCDLIVVTGGPLPAGVLQPYHTLADLTGQASTGSSGATALDLSALPLHRLSHQLAHATGQRFRPDTLAPLLPALH